MVVEKCLRFFRHCVTFVPTNFSFSQRVLPSLSCFQVQKAVLLAESSFFGTMRLFFQESFSKKICFEKIAFRVLCAPLGDFSGTVKLTKF